MVTIRFSSDACCLCMYADVRISVCVCYLDVMCRKVHREAASIPFILRISRISKGFVKV